MVLHRLAGITFRVFCDACCQAPAYWMRFPRDGVDWAAVDAAMVRGATGAVLVEDAVGHGKGVAVGGEAVSSCSLVCSSVDTERIRFYRGHSMAGTFRPGDYLTLEPVSVAAVRPGDVVVYRGVDREGAPDEVVHRVVAVTPGGLVARGDSNPRADSALITVDSLLGRVTHVERDGQTRVVRGGRWGLLRARLLRARHGARKCVWRLVVFVGRGPYRWLRNSGLAVRVWRPPVTKIRLAAEDGPLVKYVCGRRTVACWWPTVGRFQCRRPYDLIIPRPSKTWTRGLDT